MIETFLRQEELHNRLLHNGHDLFGDEPLKTDVSPPQDVIINVAESLDTALRNASRERYFVTLLDRVDGKPVIRGHADFALPQSFATALPFEPVGGLEMRGNFLLGPFRWLIHRLARFPRILLWPESSIRASDGLLCAERVRDEMPQIIAWMKRLRPEPPDVGAIVLDTGQVADCRDWGDDENDEREEPDGSESS